MLSTLALRLILVLASAVYSARGPQGPTGATGATGATGPAGAPGATVASGVDYTPGVALDWTDPDPTFVDGALDQLASRVTSVEALSCQPLDATLTALGNVSTMSDTSVYFTGTDTVSTYTVTSSARALLDDTDYSTMRSTLELGTAATANIGTTSGSVVGVGMGGTLPALNASALTGITTSQISGLGTMATQSSSSYATVDASNVADASAWRTALALGTAATANIGTTSGSVVGVGMGGTLPALNASALTGITTSQISGLGSMATQASSSYATVNASNVADAAAWRTALNVDASGAGNYAAPWGGTWTFTWDYSDGDPLNKMTQGGAGNVTTADAGNYNSLGVNAWSLTTTGTGTSYLETPVSAATGSFEFRARILMASVAGSKRWGLFYNPSSSTGFQRTIRLAWNAANLLIWSSGTSEWANLVAGFPEVDGQWVDVTWRHFQARDGAATNHRDELWIGTFLAYSGAPSSTGAIFDEGVLGIGKFTSDANNTTIYVNSIRLKTDGVFPEHPTYTYRASAFPL